MNYTTKIIIVNDNYVYCEEIKLLIKNDGIGEVIGVIENGIDILQLIEKQKPDLVLMDIEMPITNSVVTIRKVLALYPDIKIVMFNMQNKRINLMELVIAGVTGFLTKESEKNELKEAVRTIIRGEYFFSNEFMHQIVLNQN